MGGIQLCLAGASIGNGNRGVEALGRSVLDVIDVAAPGAQVTAFDDGWGVRPDASGRYPSVDLDFAGVRASRRWHRPESWTHIRAAQALRVLPNQVARRIAAADAVLDVSGGDSFTDIYGPTRLDTVSLPKEAALRARRPLVLLPQTYGPFTTSAGRSKAERLVRGSSLAYARDPWSFERLLELAGPDADRGLLHEGVDVAFALRPREPRAEVADPIRARAEEVLAGVNVSGLLRGPVARDRFGLAGDYLTTMTDLVSELIRHGAHVVFLPHVHVPGGGGESDLAAIDEVRSRLSAEERERTSVVPSDLDVAELKWCIARFDWFVGSRMHATIGALSTQVPAVGYAYSDKTLGVFETCGMGDHVVDARAAAGPAAVERMLASFETRAAGRATLEARVPAVVDRARSQLTEILATVGTWRDAPSSRGTVA